MTPVSGLQQAIDADDSNLVATPVVVSLMSFREAIDTYGPGDGEGDE